MVGEGRSIQSGVRIRFKELKYHLSKAVRDAKQQYYQVLLNKQELCHGVLVCISIEGNISFKASCDQVIMVSRKSKDSTCTSSH